MTHPSPHRRYRGQADQDARERREYRQWRRAATVAVKNHLLSMVDDSQSYSQLHAFGPHVHNPHTDNLEADDTLAAYGQQDGPLDQWD